MMKHFEGLFAEIDNQLASMQGMYYNGHYNTNVIEATDKYDALKKRMVACNVWEDWCKARGFAPSHSGFDVFA
jgi:hypothetical protein